MQKTQSDEPDNSTAPGYQIRYERSTKRVRVEFNSITIAESTQVILALETRQPTVYYFPRKHVRMDLMHTTRASTYCPFRGNASYFSLKVREQISENAAWSYTQPFEDATVIKDHIAFFGDRVTAIYEADVKALIAPENTYVNPLVDWLLRDAPDAPNSRQLVKQFAQELNSAGIPVWRLWMTIRTLHPQLLSTSYAWQEEADEVEETNVGHHVLKQDSYLQSPLAHIFDGAGGVRRRLDIPDPELDFPIVRDHYTSGATDYVAMPLIFSDGQINALTLTSKRTGGFSSEHLGYVYEILPILSRLFEVQNMRLTASNLLNTYLGKQSGQKVLAGLVKRGDGEHVNAVIWFCDLRGSTMMADSMPREQFLQILNQFFECTAGPVLEHGGEVLRFIGDAVLAVFPIADPQDKSIDIAALTAQACKLAMTAVTDSQDRIARLNKTRAESGNPEFEFGIGIHVGDVMYGNIGTEDRLEFSVIGAAANEAARIESMCKILNHPVLVSSEFAVHYAGDLQSLGEHELRGVGSTLELFTLPSLN